MYIVYNAYVNPKYSTTKLNTYKALLNFLSQYNERDWTRTHNTFLDKVGNNENDVYTDIPRFTYYTIRPEYQPRLNRITDENGNSVYCRQLVIDTLNTKHDPDQNIRDIRLGSGVTGPKNYFCGHRLVMESSIPEFRKGPVPFTGGHSWRYKVWRHCKHMNVHKQDSDINIIDEIEDTDVDSVDININTIRTVRKKYSDRLPDGWIEERMRDWRNTGWKRQGKNKKQWENKVKTRCARRRKKVYVGEQQDKWNSIDELDMCA